MATSYKPTQSYSANCTGEMAFAVRKDKNTTQRSGGNAKFVPLSTDPYDGLHTNPEFQGPIFSVGLNFNTASAATDVFTIASANPLTAIIAVRRIILTATIATTAADQLVKLIRRITLDTLGTKTVPTGVPHDSAQTATAVLAAYTANPTLGTVHASGAETPDGVFDIRRMAASVAGGTAIPSSVVFDYTAQPILIRAATEQICVNLLGTSQDLANLDLYCEWDERPTTA